MGANGDGVSLPKRVYCVRWWESHGHHVPATCCRFDIDRETLYRWIHQYRETQRYHRAGGAGSREVEQLLASVHAFLAQSRERASSHIDEAEHGGGDAAPPG